MVAAGETGVLAALLAYALLSCLRGNPAESPVVYPNRKNISSQCQGVEIQIGITSTGHKHLGFGRGVIHTCVWAKSPNIGLKRKTWAVRKRKNNKATTVRSNTVDFTEEQISVFASKDLHCFHLNIRSLLPKITEVRELAMKIKASIMFFQRLG